MANTDGDFVLAGEDCYDLQLPYYGLSYFRIGKGHLPVHRYMAQDTEMMVAVLGYNNRTVINQALLYRYILSYEPRGFKGRLAEFPLSLDYGKRVDALRRQYSDYLWHAAFLDTQGVSLTLMEGPDTGRHSMFASRDTGKRAAVVVNESYDAAITVQVKLGPRAGRLVLATPEAPEAVPSNGRLTVPPVSAAVLMEV